MTLIDICNGCQRNELHKSCPAYGTVFYCSDIEFSKEIEERCKEFSLIFDVDYYAVTKLVYDMINKGHL